MPLSPLPVLTSTSLKLDFPAEDLNAYPWLQNDTRYYQLYRELQAGSFATAYLARPTDDHGAEILPGYLLVVKMPKIEATKYGTRDAEVRQLYIQRKSVREHSHLRARLLGCEYANPTIDLVPILDDRFILTATVQPFINDAYGLDEWLYKNNLRDEPAERNKAGSLTNNWSGIDEVATWARVALAIACAVENLHLRRVTHGDIHPGNIFLHMDNPLTAIMIDFGEAFVATPDDNWRFRNPRSYLAPERSGPRFPLNEQVDVYSFGMLLYYLATGIEEEIPSGLSLRGRRSHLYEKISGGSRSLVHGDPRILDLIGRSIALDPADRPRMIDICDDLSHILESADIDHRPLIRSYSERLQELTRRSEDVEKNHNPALMKVLQRQVRELEYVFDGLETEMVQVSGTRDHLLRVLISLFDDLEKGDSWTTATTLAVWQGNALGLDGSYNSATVRAVQRGAAVRRTFVISVEELGREFCLKMTSMLKESGHPALQKLSSLFQLAISSYDAKWPDHNYIPAASDFVDWHRNLFFSLLECLHDLIVRWHLAQELTTDDRVRITRSKGLFIGICPVGTLDDIGAVREDNPASLIHFHGKKEDAKKWMLVMTDVRGRKIGGRGAQRPHLLGVRVFKSVKGVPDDRIFELEKLMNDKAVNIGSVAMDLATLAREALRNV